MARVEGVGLALSGGGFGGAGAMIGFASALDLFLLSHDITDLASYRGVSAGSAVAAYLAAGLSPHDFIRAQFTQDRERLVPLQRGDLIQPNWRELPPTVSRLSQVVLRKTRGLLAGRSSPQLGPDRPVTLGVLPSAPLSNQRLAAWLRENVGRHCQDSFHALDCNLSVVFYDLITNDRVVAGNGAGDLSEVAVTDAVLASCAIPGVFPPHRIAVSDRVLLGVDGCTAGATIDVRGELDLAVLIAFNDMASGKRAPIDHASALSVLTLSTRLLLNHRSLQDLATFMDANPECHMWVYEAPAKPLSSMLSFAAINSRARETFEATRGWLAEHLDYFGMILEDQGVRVNPHIAGVRFEDVVTLGSRVKKAGKEDR